MLGCHWLTKWLPGRAQTGCMRLRKEKKTQKKTFGAFSFFFFLFFFIFYFDGQPPGTKRRRGKPHGGRCAGSGSQWQPPTAQRGPSIGLRATRWLQPASRWLLHRAPTSACTKLRRPATARWLRISIAAIPCGAASKFLANFFFSFALFLKWTDKAQSCRTQQESLDKCFFLLYLRYSDIPRDTTPEHTPVPPWL